VIIVSGTPGTGKTVFAKSLAHEINAQYISLANYATEHRLYSGVDRRRKTRIINVRRTRGEIRKLLSSASLPLVIDTHHPESIVPNNAVRIVFVLRCDPSVLVRRLRNRKWGQEKITENVMSEILDYCFIKARSCYARRKIMQLDTSRSTVKHSVSMAKNILAGGKLPIQTVDWLTPLSKSSFLSMYLES